MALGPEKLKELQEVEDSLIIQGLEKLIDESLKKADVSPYTVPIPTSVPLRIRNKIAEIYLTAGWKRVEFKDDQREGTFIVLD